MGQPYVGEIRMFGGNFAPVGWALCNGQLLSISDYETLYQLIGTTYGGDGSTLFGVPDLRGRAVVHQGQGQGLTPRTLGEVGGVETVTLTTAQLPSHTHALGATTAPGTVNTPAGNVLAQTGQIKPYQNDVASTDMNGGAITQAGGNAAHDNLQPLLAINFIISLYGVFPPPPQ